MARQGGRVQLEQSDMRLALNMAKMAEGGFSRRSKQETQVLIRKPWAEVREEKKRGVEFPGHKKVKAAMERHPAMLRENQIDGCVPCQNGTAQNPQTHCTRKGTGAPPPEQLRNISNNSSFRQKHPGVPDGSGGSDGTSYPLTENYTLPVVQAKGHVAYVLLYFAVTFMHHQKVKCVTLIAGAGVMLKPFTQCLAMLNHSYSSLNDFQNLYIQFVFSSMYLCIYVSI